jgi:RHS repeat-associated protein
METLTFRDDTLNLRKASTPIPGMTIMTGYLYDAEGTRVAKGRISTWSCDPTVNGFQTTNDYILGPGGEQVTEMAMDANNSMAWQHTNVYAAGALLATYDNDGLHFYLNDPLTGSQRTGLRPWGGLGTRRAQTDYAGVLEQTCSSLPFGDGLSCSGGSLQAPTEHHFTGKERDAESGNDYFGARYYASSMGRWLSPDWSAKVMPVPYAKLDNPQSLNLYAYVGNNPMIRIDADGHCWPNWLCNFVTEVKNKVFHGEFTTDTPWATIRQNDRQRAKNRQKSYIKETLRSSAYQVSAFVPLQTIYITVPIDGIPVEVPLVSLGITVSGTVIPEKRTGCIGVSGTIASGEGKQLSVTAYPSQDAQHSKDVTNGFGWNFSGQSSNLAGVSVATNSSGTLTGYTVSTDTGIQGGYGVTQCEDATY